MMVLWNAAWCAVNVTMFMAWGYWLNLAAAIFLGLMFLASAIEEAAR